MKLLQFWEDKRQAYVGTVSGPVVGLIENTQFDGSVFTMAHLSFAVSEDKFNYWVKKVQDHDLSVVAGPMEQRGGKTILFRTPSMNIIEICFPAARDSIGNSTY